MAPTAHELRAWAALALPAGLRAFVDLLPWLVSLSFIGRVNTTMLAALSLTETWIYGWMIVSWSAVAMTQSTLISQAHGARSVRAMRAWAAMSFAASLALGGVVAGAWVAAKPALDAFGFDPALTALARDYTLAALPVLFLEAFNIAVATYLQAMQAPGPPLAVGVFNATVDVVVTYGLIFGFGAGAPPPLASALRGAGLGWVISSAASAAVNVFVLRWALGRELDFCDEDEDTDAAAGPAGAARSENGGGSDGAEGAAAEAAEAAADEAGDGGGGGDAPLLARRGDGSGAPRAAHFSRAAWATFLAQLLPNLGVVAMGSLQYTVVSFLAAGLGPTQIATHNALLCFFEIVHTAAAGMAEATAVRVGSHLGRGDARAARTTAAVAVAASGAWGLVVAAAGAAAHGFVGRIFSDDAAVLAQAAQLRALMWGSYAMLSVGDACSGVLEGQGRSAAQAVAGAAGGAVGIGLAVAVTRATEWGLRGLWAAMLAGYLVLDAIAVAFVLSSNWNALAAAAKERAAVGEREGGGAGE